MSKFASVPDLEETPRHVVSVSLRRVGVLAGVGGVSKSQAPSSVPRIGSSERCVVALLRPVSVRCVPLRLRWARARKACFRKPSCKAWSRNPGEPLLRKSRSVPSSGSSPSPLAFAPSRGLK